MGFVWLTYYCIFTGLIPISCVVNGVNAEKGQKAGGCDIFKGRWAFDKTYPLYNASSCPFIDRGYDCQNNGRPDDLYLKYRWQPDGCFIPKFNGREFLEKMTGKKILFVGDSLSFNMWESLLCILHNAVPYSSYTLHQAPKRSFSSFQFPNYGISINIIKNGFLVDVVREDVGRVLKLDSISTGGRWKGFDVLIFNSYHWWTHSWEYVEVGGKIIRGMDHMEAYKIAMTTWANWIDSNIDTYKTKVIFQGVSAAHLNGSEWNEPKARNCLRQTRPVEGSVYPGGTHPGEDILKSVLARMKKPVYLLDVTLLTQLRKDGHPSIYTGSGPKFKDCSHWCLPGVPDTWNQLLYTALVGQ